MDVQGLACEITQFATSGETVWMLEAIIVMKPIIFHYNIPHNPILRKNQKNYDVFSPGERRAYWGGSQFSDHFL